MTKQSFLPWSMKTFLLASFFYGYRICSLGSHHLYEEKKQKMNAHCESCGGLWFSPNFLSFLVSSFIHEMTPMPLIRKESTLLIATSLVIATVVHYYAIRNWKERKEIESSYPPLAPATLVETIEQISGSNYPWFMLRMAKETNSFTFRVNLPVFGTPMVVAIGDVETHRAVLTHPLTERPIDLMYKTFDNVTGGVPSIFSTNGEYWHKRRKLFAPAFEKNHVERMNSVVLAKTEIWIARRLRPMIEIEESFDLGGEMAEIILSALCETAFEYKLTDDDKRCYIADLDLCLSEFLFKSTVNPLRPLLGRLLPGRRRAHQASQGLMAFAKKIMDGYRKFEAPLEDTIIDRIMKSDIYDTDAERQADIVFILLAGHDTTAYSIAWTLLELARNPEYMLAIRESISGLAIEDWQRCEPLRNVVREAMRLHPVAAAGSFRATGEDLQTHNGRLIPKGSIIFLPLILLLRNPRVFINPDQFCPERWEQATKEMMDSFLPFSLGKQNCLGQALAKVEIHSVVARIVSEFDLLVAKKGEIEFFLTLKPRGARLMAKKKAIN